MIAVIGDIHGCYYTLVELYKRIIKTYPLAEVYAVGDLVDRGNFSYEVIEFIIDHNIKFAAGNHDYMFSYFFRHPQSLFARSWSLNGNDTTLYSYQGKEEQIQEHIDLILDAPLYYNLDQCFICHAGFSETYESSLSPDFREDISEIEDFIEEDFKNDRGVLWTRDKLLNIGKPQVVGHTKHEAVTYDEDSNVFYIDTGACIGNMLSAVIFDNTKIIDTLSEHTHLNDII